MEDLKKLNSSQAKKIRQKNPADKKIIPALILTALMSFLAGQGSLFGNMHPFGPAMIISCPGIFSLSALIGTSIGLIFSQTGFYLFRYLVCCVALWVIKIRFLSSRSRLSDIWFSSFVACIAICSLSAAAVIIPTRGSLYDFLVFSAEGVIAAFTSFFYKRCISEITGQKGKTFSLKNLTPFYISFATLIISIYNLEIFFISPSLIICLFAVLLISHTLPEIQGGLFSCICASALSAATEGNYNIFPVVFSTIVSGVFSPLGKAGSAISFLAVYCATTFFTDKEKALGNIINALISVFIFFVIPEKTYKKISLLLKTKEASAAENTYRKDVSQNLSLTASAINSVCSGMNKVSENLKRIDNNSERNIFCKVQQEVCNSCKEKEKCWTHGFQYTLKGFDELTRNYRSSKELNSTSFTKLFLGRCLKPKELCSSLLNNLQKSEDRLLEEIRLEEKRQLISRQMECTSLILNDFSEKFSKCSLVDNDLSEKVKDIFKSFSIRCTKAVCIINTDGIMTIKAFCKNIESDADRKALKKEIEEASFRKFNDPEVDFSPAGTTVIYRQKPWMKIKTGKIQLSSEESPICGDCLKEIADSYGNKTIILSDGMGTGGRAAIDASMTAEYFAELSEGNINPDNALKIINSVLSVKSTNESLATIDAVKFNLFSGKTEFFKAGAAISFVRKNGKCMLIESASLPLGILDNVSFAKEKVMLAKGDIVVIVSDGVTSAPTETIINEIENFNQSDPDILAQKIAGCACQESSVKKRDDITVFVGIMTA